MQVCTILVYVTEIKCLTGNKNLMSAIEYETLSNTFQNTVTKCQHFVRWKNISN